MVQKQTLKNSLNLKVKFQSQDFFQKTVFNETTSKLGII